MIPHFITPSEAWYATIDGLVGMAVDLERRERASVAPRGFETVEYDGPQTFRVDDPLAIRMQAGGRDFRHIIGIVEGLSLVGQTSVPEVILDKVAAFRPFMKKSVFWGAYGPRVAGDVGQVVDLLEKDPASRQAVITIFDSDRDLGRTEQVDLPCTVALQYQIRDGRLNAWTVMRSNDAWLGLPYDLMQFGMLQAAIAQSLNVDVGYQTHSAGSMHLYLRNLEKARALWSPSAIPGDSVFRGDLWGSDDLGEISTRARRILLGQWDRLETDMTPFETWCVELLS